MKIYYLYVYDHMLMSVRVGGGGGGGVVRKTYLAGLRIYTDRFLEEGCMQADV